MSSDKNCALDTNGNLKNASQIHWYNDPDDVEPLPLVTPDEVQSSHDAIKSKPQGSKAGFRVRSQLPKLQASILSR